MSDNPHHTRRWLINASGAAILSNVLTGGPSSAQVAGTSTTKSQDPDEASADAPISPVTTALCDYVASALDRDMPPEVVAKAKLHTLDTIAAMVSGSRLKAGEMAARDGDGLGGAPATSWHRHPHLDGQRSARQWHGGSWGGDRQLPSTRPISPGLRDRPASTGDSRTCGPQW